MVRMVPRDPKDHGEEMDYQVQMENRELMVSQSCGTPFLQHRLIMSSLFHLTYNVVKLPTHVRVLVSDCWSVVIVSMLIYICALIKSVLYTVAAGRS